MFHPQSQALALCDLYNVLTVIATCPTSQPPYWQCGFYLYVMNDDRTPP